MFRRFPATSQPSEPVLSAEQALADVRAALKTRGVFDRLLDDAVTAACAAGVPITVLARSLGIHRATFTASSVPRLSEREQGGRAQRPRHEDGAPVRARRTHHETSPQSSLPGGRKS